MLEFTLGLVPLLIPNVCGLNTGAAAADGPAPPADPTEPPPPPPSAPPPSNLAVAILAMLAAANTPLNAANTYDKGGACVRAA